jgi:hypothetical protein
MPHTQAKFLVQCAWMAMVGRLERSMVKSNLPLRLPTGTRPHVVLTAHLPYGEQSRMFAASFCHSKLVVMQDVALTSAPVNLHLQNFSRSWLTFQSDELSTRSQWTWSNFSSLPIQFNQFKQNTRPEDNLRTAIRRPCSSVQPK